MLSYLAEYSEYFGPLRLLKYLTLRTALAALTALLIGFALGPRMIRKFKQLKFGHGYIDDRTGALGASYFDKKNTPTMGGLIIFFSVFLSSVLWAVPNVWVFTSLFVYAALTVPGFRDDYLKVVHKNRNGISSWEKIAWQSLATFGALAVLLWHPDSAAKIREFLGWCDELGIQVVTLYLLSTDNLTGRKASELGDLLEIIRAITDELAQARLWSIKWVGDSEGLPSELVASLRDAEKKNLN